MIQRMTVEGTKTSGARLLISKRPGSPTPNSDTMPCCCKRLALRRRAAARSVVGLSRVTRGEHKIPQWAMTGGPGRYVAPSLYAFLIQISPFTRRAAWVWSALRWLRPVLVLVLVRPVEGARDVNGDGRCFVAAATPPAMLVVDS